MGAEFGAGGELVSAEARLGLFRSVTRFLKEPVSRVATDVTDAGRSFAGRSLRSLRSVRSELVKVREGSRRVLTRDPIDIASGEVVLRQVDVELPGVLPLVLERTHLSSFGGGSSFGPSWASTLDQRLEVDDEGALFLSADGMVLAYPVPGDGVGAYPVEGPSWPLSAVDGGYTVTEPRTGLTWHFPVPDGPGRRSAPVAAVGDLNGNRVDFRRDASGALTEVRHSAGYRVAVDTIAGRVHAFRLLTGEEPEGVVLVRFGYDPAGRLTEVLNSSGEPLRLRYDERGRLTGWLDRNGNEYRYTYDDQGRAVRGSGSGGFLSADLAYDPDGRVTRVTDSLGNTTAYHLNEALQVVAEVDPLGATTRSHWNRRDQLLARTDPLGRTTRYCYDDAGNLTEVERADGRRVTFTYNALSLPVEIVEADGAVWRRGYDARGNLLTVTDPSGATTRRGYDDRGGLVSVTDALGNTVTIRNDAAGLPVEATDPTGAVTRYARDAFGRVTAVIDPVGGVARFGWTVEGRPAWRIRPDGSRERCGYDGEGNLIEYVDAVGRVTRTEYTNFDMPTARTLPDGRRLEFSLDTELRLVTVTDPQGLTWRYDHDAAGRLTHEIDFDGREVTYTHDAAGQIAERVSAGRTTSYVRDPLGNVTERRTDGRVTTLAYDPAGRLVRAAGADADVRLDRDPLGRIVAETVNGRTLTSTYDPAGRRVARRTPVGSYATWDHDAAGRPVALRTSGQELRFVHDAAGRETHRHLGDAAIITQQWDAAGRVTTQTLWGASEPSTRARHPLQNRGYAYCRDDAVAQVTDQMSGSRRFVFDPMGRVTAVHTETVRETYVYNDSGNIVDAVWPADPPDDDAALGEREYTGMLIRRAGRTRFEHDAQGRLVGRRHRTPSGRLRAWHYTWDGDLLTEVTTPDQGRWRYRYDPFGRRIAKQRLDTDGVTVVEQVDFTWDGAVLAEESVVVGGPGRVTTWEHAPGTFRPLTQTERVRTASQTEVDERFYAIVTGLGGMPTEMVDTSGSVRWHATADLWGGRTPRPDDGLDCPLRFPGQYHDRETGLHYNVHRYYDPATARYQSADPLGLAPAPNPYAYVRNPLITIDPLGLAPYTPLYRTSPMVRGDAELRNGLKHHNFARTRDGRRDGAAHFGNEKTALEYAEKHPDTHGVGFSVDVPDDWLQRHVESGDVEVWQGFTEDHLEYVIPRELFGEFNRFTRARWNG